MIPIGDGMVQIPRGALAWQRAFKNVTPSAVLAFQIAPVPFVISGVPIARDSISPPAVTRTLGLSYTGQLGNSVEDHAARGKFSWKF